LIVPRILILLSNSSPLTHRRAAASTLSRMVTDSGYGHQPLAASVIIPILHGPFLQAGSQELSLDSPPSLPGVQYASSPTSALLIIMSFIMHTDPSPTLISTLLSPIMPCLYALSAHMNHMKTTDPLLKESTRALLATWGRVVVSKECFDNLWRVLEGAGGEWEIDIAGEIKKVERYADLIRSKPSQRRTTVNMSIQVQQSRSFIAHTCGPSSSSGDRRTRLQLQFIESSS
jgi:hypothetical protein